MSEKLALLGGDPVRRELLPQYDSLGLEETQAVLEVMQSKNLSGYLGRAGEKFLGGQKVRQLEEDCKKYFGVEYAVSFNSATTALQAAVMALGIGPGDEVITSPFTMPATATAILLNNAVPVFADIDPRTYCLDPKSIEQCITKKTRAILAVNLFGGSADYGSIFEIAKKYDLRLIEDNAQSPGAMYRGRLTGTVGDIGVLSFNVHKVIQSGEGGLLLTNDSRAAYRAQLVRNHGEAVMDDVWEMDSENRELVVGSNYRLSELHAAIVIEQLKKLDGFNAARIELADYLTSKLAAFDWLGSIQVSSDVRHVYYLYPIKFYSELIGIKRKTFAHAMAAEGFPLQEGYQKPLYLLPIYQQKRIYEHSRFPFVSDEYPSLADYSKGKCPVCEKMYDHELLVTNLCQPPKTKQIIDDFVKALEKIEGNIAELKVFESKT